MVASTGRFFVAGARAIRLAVTPGAVRHGLALGRLFILVCALGACALGACAVRLAPDFDRTIVDGLTSANNTTLTLFASVSSGSNKTTFASRKPTYDRLIGAFDALRIQAQARPTPRPLLLQLIGGGPSPGTAPKDIDVLKAPTPAILATIVDILTTMRDTDQAFGLSRTLVIGFKNEFETSIDQALVYEKALER